MRLYFDTNVYDFIAECGEVESLRTLLREGSHHVLASQGNVLEMLAIPDAARRQVVVATLSAVSTEYDRYPSSGRHALEVRHEVGRCRRQWRNRAPKTRESREFMKAHGDLWLQVRANRLPTPAVFEVYRRDQEAGVGRHRASQKETRQARLARVTQALLVDLLPGGGALPIDVSDAEQYWRLECFWVWFNAIERRDPASRDYADWLGPHIKVGAFRDPSYPAFWLEDVRAQYVPFNRLLGLVSFTQADHKIQHGNAADQIHASYLLLTDALVTCDKAFAASLSRAKMLFGGNTGEIVVMDRGAPSFTEQLEKYLE